MTTGLTDGAYWMERAPNEWHLIVIEEGQVYYTERKASILTPQTLRNRVMGPLVKPGPKP